MDVFIQSMGNHQDGQNHPHTPTGADPRQVAKRAPPSGVVPAKQIVQRSQKFLVKVDDRIFLLVSFQQIRNIYDDLLNKDENVLEAKIYTPFSLNDEQIAKIKDAFHKKTNKQIIVKEYIDKNLIAGIRVIINGTLYEYSMSSELDHIKNNLINQINDSEEEK